MEYVKNPWVIIITMTVVVFGGAIWYSSAAAERNNEGVEVVDVHVKGNPDADVVLVEYSDFQCPACRAFQPVIDDALERFGEDIRFEYNHFPLPIHPHAQAAAVAAEAAGQQDAFFAYHDLLYERQDQWSNMASPDPVFISFAEELGLDTAQFRRQMNSSLLQDKVRADFAEAQRLGLRGTPSFILNGEQMQFESYEGFITQLAAAVGATTTLADPEADGEAAAEEAAPSVQFGI